MKYILLILAAVGLTACSKGVVKNESGAEISVEGNSVADNACYEWTVVLGFVGDSNVAIRTAGDDPTQIGNQETYKVGYYVVKSVAQDEAAVEKVDEAPQCSVDDPDPVAAAALAEAKQAAVEAADAAVAAADAAVTKAGSMTPSGPPVAVTQAEVDAAKVKADAAKVKADAAKAEAEAAETVEAANAAKAKADEAKAEAEAV